MPKVISLYEVPKDHLDEIKKILDNCQYSGFVHKTNGLYELAVTYSLSAKTLEDDPEASVIDREITKWTYSTQRVAFKSMVSFFNVTDKAKENNLMILSFKNRSPTGYYVTFKGLPSKLQKLENIFTNQLISTETDDELDNVDPEHR